MARIYVGIHSRLVLVSLSSEVGLDARNLCALEICFKLGKLRLRDLVWIERHNLGVFTRVTANFVEHQQLRAGVEQGFKVEVGVVMLVLISESLFAAFR